MSLNYIQWGGGNKPRSESNFFGALSEITFLYVKESQEKIQGVQTLFNALRRKYLPLCTPLCTLLV